MIGGTQIEGMWLTSREKYTGSMGTGCEGGVTTNKNETIFKFYVAPETPVWDQSLLYSIAENTVYMCLHTTQSLSDDKALTISECSDYSHLQQPDKLW